MFKSCFSPAVIAASLVLSASAAAQQTQVLNLRDADIRAFIQDVSRATGRSFIIDPRVKGTVSVVTEKPLSRTEYFQVFLSTLRANGLVAIPAAGGAYRIAPVENAAQQPGGPRGANGFVTEVIPLSTIDAQSAMDALKPLVSKEGQLTASRSGNAVVVADYGDNVSRIRSLVRQIDRDRSTTRVISLKNSSVRDIAAAVAAINPSAGGEAAGAARGVTAVPIDASNTIVLRGDPEAVSRMAGIIADLDRRAQSGVDVRVIQLEHADAGQLLPVLQQLVGQASAAASKGAASAADNQAAAGAASAASVGPGSLALGGGRAVIARFEGANAIVISAPADVQRMLGDVVRQLDTRREQVLVEAIIVEISDNAAQKLGVQFLLAGLPGSGVPFAATNYSSSAPNILTIAGAIGARELNTTTTTVNGNTTTTTTNNAISDQLAQAAVSSILGAGGVFAGFADKIGKDAIFGAIINAVKSDTESNILSTPSVMTLDNQEAKILVGQEVPITTGQALSDNFDNAFRTVQRQNVGIQLEVKPQINVGGAIKLFLRQEVSSIAGPVSNDNSELIINKREIETTVTVDDGEIIALGGLLDDNERRTLEKIPLLGDVPVLGQLFRSKARSRQKTNLMVFIRPTILRNTEDIQNVAAQRYGYIRDAQRRRDKDGESSLDALVREYMGAVPPEKRGPLPAPANPAAKSGGTQ